MRSSHSALHAVRLVLRGWREEGASYVRPRVTGPVASSSMTAVPDRFVRFSSDQSQPLALDDFLEDETEDYEAVDKALPELHIKHAPIPWPTLLRPRAMAYPCDPLRQALVEKDYPKARTLLYELRDAGIRPREDFGYLKAALWSLQRYEAEDFFAFMELYPKNKLVWENPWSLREKTPSVFRKLQPVFREIRAHHIYTPELVTRFLEICARKFLLAPVIEHFIVDTATLLRPDESAAILLRVLDTFAQQVPRDAGEGYREEVIIPVMNKWLNVYVRRLALAGWQEEAEEFYEVMPKRLGWVSWIEPTSELLMADGQDGARWRQSRAELGLESDMARRVKQAMKVTPTPNQLATLLEELEEMRPSLARRLRRRLTQRPGDELRPVGLSPTLRILHQAEIIRLTRRNEYQGAIRYFLQHFKYIGFPPHPLVAKMSLMYEPEPNDRYEPALPTSHIVTSLLPALLETLPQPLNQTIPAFHEEYLRLAPELPPYIRPNHVSHSIFIRKIARMSGGARAHQALVAIAKAGYDPGHLACAWVLLVHAGREQHGQVADMWEKMKNKQSLHGDIAYPEPSQTTLKKLEELYTGQKARIEVENAVKRFRGQDGEESRETRRKLEEVYAFNQARLEADSTELHPSQASVG